MWEPHFDNPVTGTNLLIRRTNNFLVARGSGPVKFHERYANHFSSDPAGESTFMGCPLSYLHPQPIRLAPRFSWKSTSPKG